VRGLSKTLFKWFSQKRGDEIIVLAREHFALSKDVIGNLNNMIEASAKGNLDSSEKYFWDLHQKAHEADIVRKELINQISVSEMFPEEKMDVIDLARTINFIADSGVEAGALLSFLNLQKAPEEMMDIIFEMGKMDYVCVETLTECFKNMRSNPKKCVELTHKVESIEEQVDILHTKSRLNISTLDFVGWNQGPLYLLFQLMDSLESISDCCENTSDIIQSIAVKIQ